MNKKVLLLGSLFVFLVSLFLSVKTYSRYRTQITVSGTMFSASWHFEANDQVTSFATNLGDLYPGINRSFDINLSSVGSEVPVEYTITFSNPVNIPNKLIFYSDFFKHNQINLNGGTVTGEMGANTTKKVTIYYDWAFEGAETAGSGTASFNLSVTGRQKNPNS